MLLLHIYKHKENLTPTFVDNRPNGVPIIRAVQDYVHASISEKVKYSN